MYTLWNYHFIRSALPISCSNELIQYSAIAELTTRMIKGIYSTIDNYKKIIAQIKCIYSSISLNQQVVLIVSAAGMLSGTDAIHIATVLEDCVDQLAVLGRIMPASFEARSDAVEVSTHSLTTNP